jgi:8-oxo-dGTP pyrophosphatase MutT (NUDIX family)
MTQEVTLEALREKMAGRPYHRLGLLDKHPDLRQAAVLLPLLKAPAGLYVLFTVRSGGLSSHAGQISFPGGGLDPGESAEEAAVRETFEETGLRVGPQALWGRLDDQLSPARFVVTPVVAALPWPQALTLSPFEVEEVFTAPLAELRDLEPESEERQLYGLTRRIYFYRWRERLIWGMTANILKNFLDACSLSRPEHDKRSSYKRSS